MPLIPYMRTSDPHRCVGRLRRGSTPACTLWSDPRSFGPSPTPTKSVYVCTYSHNVHVCGSGRCSLPPVLTRENDYICPLTGIVVDDQAEYREGFKTFDNIRVAPLPQARSAPELADKAYQACYSRAASALHGIIREPESVVEELNKLIIASVSLIKALFTPEEHAKANWIEFCVIALAFIAKEGLPEYGLPDLKWLRENLLPTSEIKRESHIIRKHKITACTHKIKIIKRALKQPENIPARTAFVRFLTAKPPQRPSRSL